MKWLSSKSGKSLPQTRLNSANRHISRRYKRVFIGMICLLFGVFMVGMMTNPPATAKETKLNHSISINGLTFNVTRKLLNAEENKLVLCVTIDKQSLVKVGNATLTFEPLLLGAKAKDMEMQVYKGDSTYYEIVFSDIPERWQSLRLKIGVNDVTRSQNSLTFHRNPSLEQYEVLSDNAEYSNDFATLRWLQSDMVVIQKYINEDYPTSVEEQQKIIEEGAVQIQVLDEDNAYQTEKELKEDESLKQTIYQRMQQAERTLATYEQKLTEANTKYSLLLQQKTEVSNQTGIDTASISLTE